MQRDPAQSFGQRRYRCEIRRARARDRQSHVALREFVNGNPEPFQSLYSNQDDVTLGNPFGPFVRGRQSVVSTAAAAATRYRDGQVDSVDAIAVHASSDLACVVEVERFRAKVGGSKDPPR